MHFPKLIFISIATTIFVSIISTLGIVWFKDVLPAKVPMFYSLPWGQSQLVSPNTLFLLPILAVGITIVNILISKQLHASQLILKQLLLGIILVSDLLILLTVVRILTIYL